VRALVLRKLSRVIAEDGGALRRVGQGEENRLVEAADQGVVQVPLPVRRAYGYGRGRGVDAVQPPEEHGEHLARGLEHVLVPRPGKGVDLVQEDDGAAHVLARVEDLRQVLRRLAVPFRHDRFDRDIHERGIGFPGDDARRGRLAHAGGAVEKDGARPVGLEHLPGQLRDRVVHRRVGQRKDDRLPYLPLHLLIPGDIVPAQVFVRFHDRRAQEAQPVLRVVPDGGAGVLEELDDKVDLLLREAPLLGNLDPRGGGQHEKLHLEVVEDVLGLEDVLVQGLERVVPAVERVDAYVHQVLLDDQEEVDEQRRGDGRGAERDESASLFEGDLRRGGFVRAVLVVKGEDLAVDLLLHPVVRDEVLLRGCRNSRLLFILRDPCNPFPFH